LKFDLEELKKVLREQGYVITLDDTDIEVDLE